MKAVRQTLEMLPMEPFTQDIATFHVIDNALDDVTSQKVLPPARLGQKPHLSDLPSYTEERRLEITAKDGLPVTNVQCQAICPDGTFWVGSLRGAARWRKGQWRYFAGKRWLPNDSVTAIEVDDEGRAWLATPEGISCIESVLLTGEQKAAHYEQITQARHNRDGFVTECLLEKPGDLDSFLYEASDNDGLWTALYLCAECFRYAVTGEREAHHLAQRSLRAMLDLVRLTGMPGFPARALLREGERAQQSEPLHNWHPSPVHPGILYKGDTSSDEIAGHYLAWYVYFALMTAVDDTPEAGHDRQAIIATCRSVTDHILDNHYTLIGPDGKRTSWGDWSTETLNHNPEWRAERGLNSLSMLSHLRVAMYICGDDRFSTAYRTLIDQHGYAHNTLDQKILPPLGDCNHSDDELAACAYYPLLQLETDPTLRELYLRSLERTQAVLRPERSPFYNILYSACTGKNSAEDIADAISWLQETPWDVRDWTMTNSHRPDVTLRADLDRFEKRQLVEPLSPAEKAIMKWNRNPYQADGGNGGRGEMDGAFWLLPYWMGRYHGLIG